MEIEPRWMTEARISRGYYLASCRARARLHVERARDCRLRGARPGVVAGELALAARYRVASCARP